jgi:hypothetical protein
MFFSSSIPWSINKHVAADCGFLGVLMRYELPGQVLLYLFMHVSSPSSMIFSIIIQFRQRASMFGVTIVQSMDRLMDRLTLGITNISPAGILGWCSSCTFETTRQTGDCQKLAGSVN